jgi:Fatty acid cis/trans isomerase (CTI)
MSKPNPTRRAIRAASLFCGLIVLAGCATLLAPSVAERYGPADPTRFDAPVVLSAADAPAFRTEVLPILESRCVVCHACYDAPCQLKLGSYAGVTRGASPEPIYAGTRLRPATPTRLFIDADRPSTWRTMGFHPVLNEHRAEPEANLKLSVLYRLLAQKAAHPLPEQRVLGDEFDFSLNRSEQCPSADTIDRYEAKQPLAGMPYGLPGLKEEQRAVMARWIAAGAPDEALPPLPAAVQAEHAGWEQFLNGDSVKEQLAARYLYEHLFLGHLYFGDDPERHWFKLVRSSTPPGEAPKIIATRQPFDDPGVAKVFYRLARVEESIVAKTHMPYRLDDARMARWRTLFLGPEVQAATLPAYSANPFETFQAIPVANRYRFLLDDAAYFVDGFIKGPVCRGQIALNVINDRFWVFFADPATHSPDLDAFLAREADKLRLPNEEVGALPLVSWQRYRRLEKDYLDAQATYLQETFAARPPDQRVVWDGEGRNSNAALTVFRHFDSASVVKGLIGTPPKTAWILTYPLLERIHYLLVAGFDVYGNVGHQLNSRLYMDFLRMEGETKLLMLLPKSARLDVLKRWYRDDSADIYEKFFENESRQNIESAIRYRSQDPLAELYELLRLRVWNTLPTRHEFGRVSDLTLRRHLQQLGSLKGKGLALLPETIFLRVDAGPAGSQDFTVLRDASHSTISHLFTEALARRPEEDRLTVVAGFIGAYPNAFWRVGQADLPDLIQAIEQLREEADYTRLADRFAVRRTDPGFWAHLDSVHQSAQKESPLQFGLFDLNRLENR